MKRRTFLKALPVLAATPLTLAAMPTPSNTYSRHLIALGTAACLLATGFHEKLEFASVTLIDSDEENWSSEKATVFTFNPPNSVYQFHYSKPILKNENLPVLPLPKEIEAHLRSLDGELVFHAGLGKATGTLLFQSIGLHYHNPVQSSEWIAMMPFAFEGSRSQKQAQLTIHLLADNRREPTCLYLDEIRSRFGNLSIRSAYEKADEWAMEALNQTS